MNILMTGATGLIGRSLTKSLAGEGHKVIALTRSPKGAGDLAAAKVFGWDPLSGPPPAEVFDGVNVVVHLAGEPIAARRWTAEQKRRIRDSRLISTRHLVNAMRSLETGPAAFVSGSAVGFYGDRGDEPLEEMAPAGSGFLPELCVEWEHEAECAAETGMRVVLVRTGVVLSTEGGALQKMLPPFKLGVAGRLGGGRQWFPWIHIADIVGIFRHAIFAPSLSGPVNGTAPAVVTNAEFTNVLARALHRPALLPAPEFALKLLMGEMAYVLLASQRVIPKVALEEGYEFHYPQLPAALDDLVGKKEGVTSDELQVSR